MKRNRYPAREGRKRRQDPIRRWVPTDLYTYLLKLQAEYRQQPALTPSVCARGAPSYAQTLAHEAAHNVFNADHIVSLLVGLRGPWAEPKLELWALPFALAHLRHVDEQVRSNGQVREQLRKRNRQFQSVINQIRALPFPCEEDRQHVLNLLARQQISLRGLSWRPAPRFGVTRRPTTAPAGQALWTPVVLQLVAYLRRTIVEPEGVIFRIAARILHLASDRVFPDAPPRVKQRWYRSAPPALLGVPRHS